MTDRAGRVAAALVLAAAGAALLAHGSRAASATGEGVARDVAATASGGGVAHDVAASGSGGCVARDDAAPAPGGGVAHDVAASGSGGGVARDDAAPAPGESIARDDAASAALPPSGAAGPGHPPALDFVYYRERVEPIFFAPRDRFGPGGACVTCHTGQAASPLRLEPLREGAAGNVYWTEDQSRRNLGAVARLVVPGRPEVSRLLLKPLAVPAGGVPFHTGGKHWEDRSDPEYRTIADWIARSSADAVPAPEPPPALDREFFRQCVQRVFLDRRPGGLACADCHASGVRGFARPVPEGLDAYDEETTRQNYETVMRFVEPGDPDGSGLLMKPLHPDAGGVYMHNGGRRWASRDDPEWRMLAAWVLGASPVCVVD